MRCDEEGRNCQCCKVEEEHRNCQCCRVSGLHTVYSPLALVFSGGQLPISDVTDSCYLSASAVRVDSSWSCAASDTIICFR
jgi:hypothetical protein